MNPIVDINERVDVVAIFRSDVNERMICVPWKMKYKNQEIILNIFGMRHLTAQGKRMIHVFEMSDGVNDYRLEFDAERLVWTLVNMVAGHDE